MSKKTIVGLISGVVILLILIGAVVALIATKPRPEQQQEMTSELAYEKNYNDIKTLHYKNQYGEVHLSRDAEGGWKAEEFPDADLDDEYITMIARSVSKVILRGDIEKDADDLNQYGFNKPSVEVKVAFNDSADTVKEFKVGNPLVTEGRSYFKFNDENNVYWVMDSDFYALNYHPYSIIDRTVLAEIKPGAEVPEIEYVNVKRADLDYEIEAVLDELAQEKVSSSVVATHKLVKPIEVPLEPYDSAAYIKGLYGLRAANIVEVNPAEETLNNSGIFLNSEENVSACVVEMKAEGKIYRLHLGTPLEQSPSEIYGYFEGKNVLYSFKSEELPWIVNEPTDIVNPLLITYGIYDVSKIEVSTSGSASVFELSGDEASTFKSVLNGKEVDKEYFRRFYSFLLSVSPDEVCLDIPEDSEPIASITLTPRKQVNEVIKLDFYDGGGRTAIVVQNDKPVYKCRMAFVEKLKENIKLLENEEEIISVW